MEDLRNEKGQTLEEFLAAYDAGRYPRPSVTVDMTVFTILDGGALGILLIKRRDHPFIGRWALPGGFLNMDEDLEAAAARELFEETGVEGLPLKQFHTFGAVDRDPRTRVITVGHLALARKGSLRPKAGDDAREAELFSLSIAKAGADTIALSLNGPDTFTIRAHSEEDGFSKIFRPLAPYALASDHDAVLIGGLLALLALPRAAAVAALGGDATVALGALDTLLRDS